jgi:hypothetical protein
MWVPQKEKRKQKIFIKAQFFSFSDGLYRTLLSDGPG